MRIDHFAYQRATRVASVGFGLQFLMGLTMLLFSLLSGEGDTAFRLGSMYILCGVAVWLSLIIVFHQHKLERLEALEEDEIAASREAGGGSIFEPADEEIRVAARRLRLMHKWMMPAVSVVLALVLAGFCWMSIRSLNIMTARGEDAMEAVDFAVTTALGWAVAICLGLAAVSFIFSRFVSGMAQQTAWQNLRGGAGFMVGNSLVCLATATGITFRFFDPESTVIVGIAYGVAGFMGFLAAETVLNLIMNFYRPRIPGEVPRPAFDSRVLSIFSAPDTLVRSINEAVNYQFGFDVTSTWGYQLLMRSLIKLFALGAVVLLVLSTMVVVEPHQQAIRLTGGRITDQQPHESGLMLKWPWPVQTAQVYDVSRLRRLPLTALKDDRRFTNPNTGVVVNTWATDLNGKTDRELEPFLVRQSRLKIEGAEQVDALLDDLSSDDGDTSVTGGLALVDMEIVLEYRIKDLYDYLNFAPDTYELREALTIRERILRGLALRRVSELLATMSLDQVLSSRRVDLSRRLRDMIQEAFDANAAGIDVTDVAVTMVRPSGEAAANFEDLMMARQDMEKDIANARRLEATNMTRLIGKVDKADTLVTEIDAYNTMWSEFGADAAEVVAQRDKIERMIRAAGGSAGQIIDIAETERWVRLMETMAQSSRIRGELSAFRAAPDLYRQRAIMNVLAGLTERRKFFLFDPSRFDVFVEFKDLNLQQQYFQPSTEAEGDSNQGGS